MVARAAPVMITGVLNHRLSPPPIVVASPASPLAPAALSIP